MNRKTEETPAQKRTRAMNITTLRAVVAAYLVYLGGSLIVDYLRGRSGVSPILAWGPGLLFIAAGIGFGYYTWKIWRAAAAAAEPSAEEEQTGTGE